MKARLPRPIFLTVPSEGSLSVRRRGDHTSLFLPWHLFCLPEEMRLPGVFSPPWAQLGRFVL